MANLNDVLRGQLDTELLTLLDAMVDRSNADLLEEGALETVTAGAISAVTRTSLISVTGTEAYTLADGSYEGQRKTLYCVVAATTPDGTITPATLVGGTTLDMDAVSESYELEWHASGWNVVNTVGGAIT